jgi:type 1 glutamine amidotransferase
MTALCTVLRRFAVSLLLLPLLAQGAPETAKLKVMLLTGQCSKYHNWTLSSKILKRILDETGRFTVDTVLTPPPGSDMSGFHPDFKPYDVIVMDYEGDEWPEATKQAFAEYVSGGGGLVSFHDTDNAFPKWREWNEMIGVGGWGGRNESSGPKVRWRDGRMVLDYTTPGNATHPPKHDFVIETRAPEHPVLKGLPLRWLHASDEMYSQLRGPATNLTVLATAYGDKTANPKASGEHEPMLMAIAYGKGRIFHITLGHVGPGDVEPVKSVGCSGFQTVLQRGTEWAGTGKVTMAVPADFPTAEATSVRK